MTDLKAYSVAHYETSCSCGQVLIYQFPVVAFPRSCSQTTYEILLWFLPFLTLGSQSLFQLRKSDFKLDPVMCLG